MVQYIYTFLRSYFRSQLSPIFVLHFLIHALSEWHSTTNTSALSKVCVCPNTCNFVCFSNTFLSSSLPHRPNSMSFERFSKTAIIKTTIRYACGPTLQIAILKFSAHIITLNRFILHTHTLSPAAVVSDDDGKRVELKKRGLVT